MNSAFIAGFSRGMFKEGGFNPQDALITALLAGSGAVAGHHVAGKPGAALGLLSGAVLTGMARDRAYMAGSHDPKLKTLAAEFGVPASEMVKHRKTYNL